jgi:hypothetical protein
MTPTMMHEKIKRKINYVCKKTNPSTMIYKHVKECCEEFDQKTYTQTLIPNIYHIVWYMKLFLQFKNLFM